MFHLPSHTERLIPTDMFPSQAWIKKILFRKFTDRTITHLICCYPSLTARLPRLHKHLLKPEILLKVFPLQSHCFHIMPFSRSTRVPPSRAASVFSLRPAAVRWKSPGKWILASICNGRTTGCFHEAYKTRTSASPELLNSKWWGGLGALHHPYHQIII